MSILGIRNGIRDATLRVAYAPTQAASQLGACRWLEDAIEDWGNKYPRDTWLPGMAISLDRLYARIGTAQSYAQAHRMLAWIHREYRGSGFERLAFAVARQRTVRDVQVAATSGERRVRSHSRKSRHQ